MFEPKSSEINNEVYDLAIAKGVVRAWIGIHDHSNEGNFVYESNDQPIEWANWDSGEPNNLIHMDDSNGEDCVHIGGDWMADPRKWNDDYCHWEFAFICEKPGMNHSFALALCFSHPFA